MTNPENLRNHNKEKTEAEKQPSTDKMSTQDLKTMRKLDKESKLTQPEIKEWSKKGVLRKVIDSDIAKKILLKIGVGAATTKALGDVIIDAETTKEGWSFANIAKFFKTTWDFFTDLFRKDKTTDTETSKKEENQIKSKEEDKTTNTETSKKEENRVKNKEEEKNKNLPPEFQEAIASVKNQKRKDFLRNIAKDLGINEKEDADKIIGFHKKAKGKEFETRYTEETAWCMSWALSKMKEAGKLKDKFSFFSKDALKWGTKVKTPVAGDLVIVERITKDGKKMGHIGIFLKYAPNGNPILISGNIGDKVVIHTENRKILGFRNILGKA